MKMNKKMNWAEKCLLIDKWGCTTTIFSFLLVISTKICSLVTQYWKLHKWCHYYFKVVVLLYNLKNRSSFSFCYVILKIEVYVQFKHESAHDQDRFNSLWVLVESNTNRDYPCLDNTPKWFDQSDFWISKRPGFDTIWKLV